MQNLQKIIELASKKCDLDITREDKKLLNPNWLLDSIITEAEEVREEMYPNNNPHLEDELGDILWSWITLVEKLKREGLVSSHEDIFKRTIKKYEERIEPLNGTMDDYNTWKEVKVKQKEALEREKFKML